MSEPLDGLLKLPPKPVALVLEELHVLRQKANRGEAKKEEVPLVTLHLRSGRDLAGWLISLDLKSGDAISFLRHGPDLRQGGFHVCYLAPRDIEAITIHEAQNMASSQV